MFKIKSIYDIVTNIPSLCDVIHRIRLVTGFALTWATRLMPHVDQNSINPSGASDIILILWLASCCSVFIFLCCVFYTFLCLFVFFGVVSFFFRLISLNLPLVSFAPLSETWSNLLYIKHIRLTWEEYPATLFPGKMLSIVRSQIWSCLRGIIFLLYHTVNSILFLIISRSKSGVISFACSSEC